MDHRGRAICAALAVLVMLPLVVHAESAPERAAGEKVEPPDGAQTRPTAPATGTENTAPTHENRLGAALGTITGVGVSFGQLSLESGWGWQLSGFPLWSKDDRLLSGGVKVYNVFHRRNQWRLFAAFGAAVIHSKSTPEEDDVDGADRGEVEKDTILSAGPSIGVELVFDDLAASIEVPAAVIIPLKSEEDLAILPVPCIQLNYRW